MNKLIDFLGGIKIIEEIDSPVNGKIEVIRSFAFGTYIQVGGLTQTGGVVNDVWRTALKKVQSQKFKVDNCLILGLGGGGNAKLVRKYWPEAKIKGLDIDPRMIEVGEKYFKLNETKVSTVISDAFDFLNKELNKKKPELYDMVLVDLYKGSEFPAKFEEEPFPKTILKILKPGGVAIFNRLYYGEKRREAVKFLGRLEKIFPKVGVVYPEANVMYVCYTSKN